MNGGPSQFETFDPKPGTSTGGDCGTIKTSVPGLSIAETLPEISQHMHQLSVLRSLSSREGEHVRAQYFLHTGYPFVSGFPRPALGSVVSRETPELGFPRYVTIGPRGFGPAYMGPEHTPFTIENPDQALQLMRRLRRKRSRLGFLQELGRDFDERHATSLLKQRDAMIGRIQTMLTTPFVRATNLESESEATRERYGMHEFGQACLLARRLLEIGVNFVEVQHDGWDTHGNNLQQVRNLCESIDGPWAALMDDLQSSEMLDDTVVLWMGEFGRTPRINAQRGRDHFPQVTPVVVGGGGMSQGQVIGSTNRLGTEVDGDSVSVADLFATLMTALGIDPNQTFQTSFGSPTSATDGGVPIAGL